MMRKWIITLLALALCPALWAQRYPERAEVRKGNRLFNKGEYQKSAERYRRATEAAPQSFEAQYDLGNALYRTENYEQAEQLLTQLAADTLLPPADRAHALYNLGNARFRQQNLEGALESYKQALRIDPDDQQARYNYAYTKKLLEQQQDDQNGGDSQQQQQEQNRDQNGQQEQQSGADGQQDQDGEQEQQQDPAESQPQEGSPDGEQEPEQPGEAENVEAGISPQEQERMLDAIQSQEDRTQEKLKERGRVPARGGKNW